MDENSSVEAKAAATLSRHKFLRPLRALCIRKVASSLKFYVDRGVTSLHSYLLTKLCEEVFDRYVQQMRYKTRHCYLVQGNAARPHTVELHSNFSNSQKLEIASLFVNAELKCFNTTVLCDLKNVKSELEERKLFFKKLAEEAPNLATFIYDYDRFDIIEESLLTTNYICLGQMSQLITLKIGQFPGLKNADLQVLGQSLPLLRNLSISFERNVTIEEGVEHLQQLKMLENLVISFPYSEDDDDEEPERTGSSWDSIIEFCLAKMPKLKIAGYDLEGESSEEFKSHSFSIFEEMQENIELPLEQLKLQNDFPPANVSLPHVTHLKVEDIDALNFCLGQTFPKLKKLFVYGVPYKDAVKLLQRFGHLLTTLDLTFVTDLCDLWEILNLCPLLECFYVEYSYVKDIDCINPSVSKLLAKMKIFYVGSPEFLSTSSNYCKAPGLLKLLMTSCPNLEQLTLHLNIPQSEVDEVATGIASGAFLCTPKMKRVVICVFPLITNESMENFVQQVAANCPKITNIDNNNFSLIFSKNFGPLSTTLQKFNRSHVISGLGVPAPPDTPNFFATPPAADM